MTSSICAHRTMTRAMKNEALGTTSCDQIAKRNIERCTKQAPELYILHLAAMKTRLGCLCWRRLGRKHTETTHPSTAASQGMYALLPNNHQGVITNWPREAIEDLTGGVTCEFFSTDILDKEAFWKDQLLKVGKD